MGDSLHGKALLSVYGMDELMSSEAKANLTVKVDLPSDI